MANLPPQYVIGPQHGQQSLPYENVNTDLVLGPETFVVPYPVSSGECSRLFSAICEADHGRDNQIPAQMMYQELWNTGFGG
jgi:hypothetical protein